MTEHGLQTRNTNREPEKIRSLRAWRLHKSEGDRMWGVWKEKGPFKAEKPGVWVPGRKAAGVAVTVAGANEAEESRDHYGTTRWSQLGQCCEQAWKDYKPQRAHYQRKWGGAGISQEPWNRAPTLPSSLVQVTCLSWVSLSAPIKLTGWTKWSFWFLKLYRTAFEYGNNSYGAEKAFINGVEKLLLWFLTQSHKCSISNFLPHKTLKFSKTFYIYFLI